ncbi:MAG: translation initiation factor IF-2 [Firmicutes bacterium]|nr:translation initiation factor IF-2 [Bacillota bacterium]
MNKMRVHELSKELGISPKELLHFLNDLGANVRNHMSTIEDKFVEQARQTFPSNKQSRFLKTDAAEASPAKSVPKPTQGKPTPELSVSPAPAALKAERTRVNESSKKSSHSRTPETAKKTTAVSGRVGERAQEKRAASLKPPIKPEARAAKAKTSDDKRKAKTIKSGPEQARPQPKAAAKKQQKTSMPKGPVARPTVNRKTKPTDSQTLKSAKPKGPMTTVKSVQLPPAMTVKDFSQLIEVSAGDVIKKLMGLGMMATINQEIDLDTMILLADEYNISASAAQTEEEKLQVEEIEDDPASLVPRPPVVTIMGHVDHGKTSLLDAIRETNVTAQETGGITQHIGAYQVELKERKITFLDTPGHEAFTAMRARGAQATDIAILVVAADDGVMPQTVEAINHAKDANVPIIVAINKIDKPGANPDRIKQDLTEHGLVAEEWGGDTIFVPVSAKKREGIEQLLEMILLVADMKELKANPNRPAKGTVIEAQLDKGRGPVATVLIQTGTLEIGNPIIAGTAAGKVRVLTNEKGKKLKKAGPSTPVEVIGFNELPEAGDIFYAVTEDRVARVLADKRMQLKRENELKRNQKVTLDDLFTKIKEGEIKELKIVLKADVQGSVEAIRQSLERLSNDEVRVKVIHGGVGGIGEGDVMLASASNAIVIGFNVRPDPMAKRIAEKESVDIRLYRIIYEIIDDVQKAMEGMLAPDYKEVITGRAEIRAIYKVPKVGNVAGCYVIEGKISRNNNIRLIRDNIVLHDGKILSLKRFKDDVREVSEGFECGIGLEKFNDIKEGDIIEAYAMEEIKRTAVK